MDGLTFFNFMAAAAAAAAALPAPTFVAASAEILATSGSTETLPLPAGWEPGHLMVLVMSAGGNVTFTPPGGWTERVASNTTNTAAAGTRLRAYTRTAGLYEEGQLLSASQAFSAQVFAFEGGEYDTQASDVEETIVTPVVVPAVVTSEANCAVLALVGHATNTTTDQASGWANANLADLTELSDVNNSNHGGFAAAFGTKAAAGSSGTTAAALATASRQNRAAISIKPAVHTGWPASSDATFRAAGALVRASGAAAGIDIPMPASIVVGELLVVIHFHDDSQVSDATGPSDWTRKVFRADVGGQTCAIAVWEKIADGTEAATEFFGMTSVGHGQTGICLAYSDAIGISAIGTLLQGATETLTCVAPSITPASPGVLLAFFAMQEENGHTVATPPSGMTQRGFQNADGPTVAVYELDPSPAGATGDKTIVFSGGTGAADNMGILIQVT